MKLTSKLLTIAIITGTALYGCDSDDDDASANSDTSMPAPGETPTDPVTVDGLAGQWATACAAMADSAEYSSATMTIADNVATITESFFTDNACATAASPAVVVSDNSLVFDNSTSTTSLGEASNFESTVESKTVDGTPDNENVNTVVYDILLITNDTLYFGDKTGENNGTSATLRPQTLDQTLVWSRI